MEERLVPINGLIALIKGEGAWPACLGWQGFSFYRIEAPVSTNEGNIRADAIIYRHDPALVLLCECKSGNNVDQEQAAKYAAASKKDLERRGLIPSSMRDACLNERSRTSIRSLAIYSIAVNHSVFGLCRASIRRLHGRLTP